MDIFHTIVKEVIIFLKKTKSFFKFLFYIGLLVFAWLVNDSLGFIRSYRISNKIEQIESLEKIIQSPKIDLTTKKSLQEYENQIIQRESLLERLYLFLSEKNTETPVKNNAGTVQTATTNINSSNIDISRTLNLFLHIFSSSWLGVIFFLYFVFETIRHRKSDFKPPLMLMIVSLLNVVVFSLITLLFPKSESLLVQYLINAVFYSSIQLILLLAIFPYILDNTERLEELFS